MRKTLLALVAALGVLAGQANADFTFNPAGTFNVVAGTGTLINLNDVANSAGVTSDTYAAFTVTADWAAGGGDPWSSEAEITLTSSAGSVNIDPPTTGGAGSGAATTLTFSGGLSGPYDPDTDGFLDLFLDQSFAGSDANWSNISVTIETYIPPPPPVTDTTLTANGFGALDSYVDAAYGSGDVVWAELIYDGVSDLTIDTEGSTSADLNLDTEIGIYDADGFLVASDDDGGTGQLSTLTLSGLSAGTYYVAASTFNTTFGLGFDVTTTGTEAGTMVINASTAPVPEPGSCLLIGMVAVGLISRRRRS